MKDEDDLEISGRMPMLRIDGGRIRRIREDKGLTQLYLATYVQVTTDTVSRWENRKYQTIKKENAVKLAEALDVQVDDILETITEDKTSPEVVPPIPEPVEQDQSEPAISSPHALPLPKAKNTVPAVIILAALTGLLIAAVFWYQGQGDPASGITVERYTPGHVAPGQTFPILVKVAAVEAGDISYVLREQIPPGCTLISEIPPVSGGQSRKGTIKWLGRFAGKNRVLHGYILRAPSDPDQGRLSFSGSVTVSNGKGSEVQVTNGGKGKSFVALSPFHWADSNRNNVIDDDEILTVYERFGEMPELAIGNAVIEELWIAEEYSFDSTTMQYLIAP